MFQVSLLKVEFSLSSHLQITPKQLYYVLSKAFVMTKSDKIFLGYQLCQVSV